MNSKACVLMGGSWWSLYYAWKWESAGVGRKKLGDKMPNIKMTIWMFSGGNQFLCNWMKITILFKGEEEAYSVHLVTFNWVWWCWLISWHSFLACFRWSLFLWNICLLSQEFSTNGLHGLLESYMMTRNPQCYLLMTSGFNESSSTVMQPTVRFSWIIFPWNLLTFTMLQVLQYPGSPYISTDGCGSLPSSFPRHGNTCS